MRRITEIILHCAASRPDQDIGAAEIDAWHHARGWSGIGYHWVIRREGTIEAGRSEAQMGAHVRGRNQGTIGVCLAGGFGSSADDAPEDHFTLEQLRALAGLLRDLRRRYPGASVTGHNAYAAKACPGFRVPLHLARIMRLDPVKDQPAPQRIEDVRALQRALIVLGYQPGEADGAWGPLTMGAARAFLTRHRINQIAAAPKPSLFAAVQVAITAAEAA
ncbi:MAG: N-acetylmuramoyl-L-alanine amidase [Paracoccaceae bacterium]|jgi:N-acetyl-anhydromuramyl-L-alanine amidase AmpD